MDGNITIDDEICFNRYLFSQIYSLIWCIITITLFLYLFYTMLNLRHAFHPFFSFYFTSLLFLYIACMSAQFTLRFFQLELYIGIFSDIVLNIQNYTYFLVSPINVFCVSERICATSIRRYEYSRNYVLFGFSIVIAISLATVLAFTEFGAAYVVGYALMAQALISLLCIFILYFVNRHRTKILTTCGGGELTLRYQLAENIKAMKALIPFLLLDNMITWNDQLFDLLFEVNYLQPPILCTKSTNNLLFLVSTTTRSLFCASQSLIILSYHELFRKKFLDIFCFSVIKRPPEFMSRRTQPTCKMKKLSNVLGAEIKLAITQQEYFDMMKTYW